jgi:hypothetical protein
MTIAELILLCQRRIANLTSLRTTYATLGDVEAVERADAEISTTETTLAQLRTLE